MESKAEENVDSTEETKQEEPSETTPATQPPVTEPPATQPPVPDNNGGVGGDANFGAGEEE